MSSYYKLYLIFGLLAFVGGIGLWAGSRKYNAGKKRENAIKYLIYVLLIVIFILSLVGYKELYVILCSLIALFVFGESLIALRKVNIWKADWQLYPYVLLLIIFLLGFVFSYQLSIQLILFIYTIVVVFDAFSQVWGQLLGRRKLVAEISPGKTMEGLAGGILSACLVAFWIKEFVPSNWNIILLLSIVIITAFMGDIGASFLKRKAKIKDFSNVLPGQGGVLDRYDSLIWAIGTAFWVWKLFL